MSTKPTSIARWADVGGAITIPPSGKQDIGWVAGEAPPAQYFNWIENIAYQWQKWLLDGNCTFAALAALTFSVTGATTLGITGFTGLLTASAGITVPTGQSLILAGTATLTVGTGLAAFGGAVTVAGTLGVTGLFTPSGGISAASFTGLLTAAAGITVPTGQTLTLAGTATLTAGGLITASAGVTVPTGSSYTAQSGATFVAPLYQSYKHSGNSVSKTFTLSDTILITGSSPTALSATPGAQVPLSTQVAFRLPELPIGVTVTLVEIQLQSFTAVNQLLLSNQLISATGDNALSSNNNVNFHTVSNATTIIGSTGAFQIGVSYVITNFTQLWYICNVSGSASPLPQVLHSRVTYSM